MHYPLLSQRHILATKVRIPPLATTVVERPRLYTLLEHGLARPLTVLAAPPGFGKTTLLADWLRRTDRGERCFAWVSLTQHDNNLQSFWSYLFAAVEAALVGSVGELVPSLLLAEPDGVDAALIHLLNSLHERATPLVVVIDNYQHITSPEVNDSLTFVVEHLPQHVHIVVMASHEPQLPLPRWRARGLVNELRAEHLSYTTYEAHAFFAADHLHRSVEEIEPMIAYAEGWFAGLRLISTALRDLQPVQPFLAERVGSLTYEYVRNEVLADQPAAFRSFLLHTSVLDEFCAELCDAVLDSGATETTAASRHTLHLFERLNLFVVPLDKQRRWYRYNHLFRAALHHLVQLEQPELAARVAQRASAWYLAHNQLDTAIEYALRGGAWQQAATLIEGWLHEAVHQRQSDRVRRASVWFAQLPDAFMPDLQRVVGLQTARRRVALPSPSEAVYEREVGATLPANDTLPPASPERVWNTMVAQELSAREHEVLALIAEGASNYEIAEKLTLSLHTVKRHASNILSKLNAANRTQAVAYARAYGFLTDEAIAEGEQGLANIRDSFRSP